jgi:hypothetical protein
LDDQGTTWLDDDQWERLLPSDGLASIILFDRLPGGDVWYATYEFTPLHTVPWVEAHLFQLSAGMLTSYALPTLSYGVTNYHTLQIIDEQRVLVGYAHAYTATLWKNGLALFSNGGTPQDPSDDQTQELQVDSDHAFAAVALDTRERFWYADNTGVYRYDNNSWGQISTSDTTCRLIPAADGAMLIVDGWPHCGNVTNSIHWVSASNKVRNDDIALLVNSDIGLFQSTTLYNAQWAVAPDGAVWYLTREDDGFLRLHRYNGDQEFHYTTPLSAETAISTLEVDANNHVWITADGDLWRLSSGSQPDFVLALHPTTFLMAPGTVAKSAIMPTSQGGLLGNVTLEAQGLPPELSVSFSPNPLSVKRTGQFTITAASTVSEGLYTGQIVARLGSLSHAVAISITVTSDLHPEHLPLVAR